MINPKINGRGSKWFCWGVSARKRFKSGSACLSKSYYGISTNNCWWLDGRNTYEKIGHNKEKIREKISFSHFGDLTDGEVDIYMDCDAGILRICVVGMLQEDKEVEISGLDKSGNNDGWVPNLLFGSGGIKQKIQVAAIDSRYYGAEIGIKWDE